MIVYKITNKANDKIYIGQTTRSLTKRWAAHCSYAKTAHRSAIRNAIHKYGKENFEIKVMANCQTLAELNHREAYYIRLFKTLSPQGYNLMTGGGRHRTISEETRLKQKATARTRNLGKVRTPQMRKNYSASKKGRKNPNYGKPSPNKGVKTGVPSPRACAVIDTASGVIYPSIQAAASALGCNMVNLWSKLNGKRRNTTSLRKL